MRVDPEADEIRIDGRRIRQPEQLTYIMLHKPSGVLSSLESQGGWPTVIELVNSDTRIYPVGRLDLTSEGLVLLTNDGELAHRLTHPRFGHKKEYRVLLDRSPSQEQLRQWRNGVRLASGIVTSPADVRMDDDSSWLTVVLREGRKRQIRENRCHTRLGD